MRIEENVLLTGYNSFGIRAVSRGFARFSGLDDLNALLELATRRSWPVLILGGGSNILFTRDFGGMVLKNDIRGIGLIREDERYVYVRAGAGENWHGFVEYCLRRNWAGVENLSLIPGSVGATPIQNIGAYGAEIKEVFYELEAWSLEDKKVYTFSLNDCEMGYRDSVFKQRYKGKFVILNVVYRLNKSAKFNVAYGAIREELDRMGVGTGSKDLTIRAVSEAVIRIRRSKLPDPAQIGNAGSFFKNPLVQGQKFAELQASFPGIAGFPNPDGSAKLAAAWLIEQCGWKGYRDGDVGCHDRQPLVLVNYGNAAGAEIFALSEEIASSVRKKFGVELEREVNIV